jgi:D-hydroxyproline dehydrogenase subunit alpha
MPELVVDGRRIAAGESVTVAAALGNAGIASLRESVAGERRGVLCAMGICFECRVTIDGGAHRRACMEPARDGMRVSTAPQAASRVPDPAPALPRSSCRVDADVAIVGAGPAGIAAACAAAEGGARTVVLDDALGPGGQIHRHRPGSPPPPAALPWLERLARSGADVRFGASVFDAARVGDSAFRLHAETREGSLEVSARRVVLATGARELFLPFPGWTLPGVLGAGGAQALWKSGADFSGRTAVVAGSGPLLLPVAASLAKAGARVALVVEQASAAAIARFTLGLLRAPGKLREAVRYRSGFAGAPYRTGRWIARALGGDRLEVVVVSDGRRETEMACDLLAVGFGLVPNTELARLLGCAMRGGAVEVDARQRTSVPGVACAGEPCGVAGVEAALAEGEAAGRDAAGRLDERSARILARRRRAGRRLAARMASAFRPRRELAALAGPETVVCRCEDVSLRSISGCSSVREAKLVSRAGMGPCQGRVCGPALEFLFGWDSDTVRPPARPALLGHLAVFEE